MKKLINKNGITVRQLKKLVKDLPETNDNGEEFEVWIGAKGNTSNVCKSAYPLNEREDGSDLILAPADVPLSDDECAKFTATLSNDGHFNTQFNYDENINVICNFIDNACARLQELKSDKLIQFINSK